LAVSAGNGIPGPKGLEAPSDRCRSGMHHWEYGHEELYLTVNSYLSGNNLYIGLESDEGSFADLTVNLPAQRLAPNEAFVSGGFAESKIEFIKKT